jgi:quinolinate synthase
MPDEHLGRNSALAMGIPEEKISVWNPKRTKLSLEQARDAQIVVWKGYCNVHTFFTPQHVKEKRSQYPGIRIVVHPECPSPVVALSDDCGSTSHIIRVVEGAPAGTCFAVGTETSMVERLDKENVDKRVLPLARSKCGAMQRINPSNLCYTLEHLAAGDGVNIVQVRQSTARWANKALQKMLDAK